MMKIGPATRRCAAMLVLALTLCACGASGEAAGDGAGGAPAPHAGATPPLDREQLVQQVASTLRACSYDGQQVVVQPSKLEGTAPADCRAMVDEIMAHTGLPANFVVTAGEVPNALAVILLDDQRVPRRVIAFNPKFMDVVQALTGERRWTPASIMAHEIGHHLSGHTITEGGSRPEIELEADKFSGYVLQKMGASLDDASRAILAIAAPTEHAGSSHPGRARRGQAIAEGWRQACRQASDDCTGAVAAPADGQTPGDPAVPPRSAATAALPPPDPEAIPFKYGRFVVDETGRLDRAPLEALEARLFDLAKEQGLELALLVVDDLHGMDANQYAWAMMRQLRIGKLDLGNGGVFVVAPVQGKAGVAFAPGVARQLEFQKPVERMQSWIDDGWKTRCLGAGGCGSWTGLLVDTMDHAIRWADDVKWEIRFQGIDQVIAETDARLAERRKGRKWDPKVDNAIGSLVRFTGKVTDLDPEPDFLRVHEGTVKDGRWKALLVETDDGREVTLYMQPQTPSVMPGGALEVGKRYSFVGELKTAGQFHTEGRVIQGNVQLWLFSYDPIG